MKNFALVLAGLALAGSSQSQAADKPAAAPGPSYTVEAVYDVSYLGVSIGEARMQFKVEGGKYEARFYGQPAGLASLFTSNAVNGAGTGQGRLGAVTSGSSWVQQLSPKKTQIVSMTYEGGQLKSVSADPAYSPSPDAPTDAQKAGANDPIGGFATMLMPPGPSAGEKACGTTNLIYDGRRVYAFYMWSGGMQSVDSGAGGYEGNVLFCIGTYHRIAGWDAAHLAKDPGVKVQQWLAPVGRNPDGSPAFYLPVRLWSEASMGSIVAIPEEVTINGKPWQEFFAEGGT